MLIRKEVKTKKRIDEEAKEKQKVVLLSLAIVVQTEAMGLVGSGPSSSSRGRFGPYTVKGTRRAAWEGDGGLGPCSLPEAWCWSEK